MFIFNLQYPCKRRHPYAFCHAKRESDVLGGWIGKICLSWRFVWQSGSKKDTVIFERKNIINKYKKLQRMHVCFPFRHGSYVGGWEVGVLDGFLSSAFVISPQKKALTSHFCISKHVENWKVKSTSYVYSFRNHILTFSDRVTCRYLRICSHLLKKSLRKTSLFMQYPCQKKLLYV